MTQSPPKKCSMRLTLHIIDCVALVLIIVFQGSILDYYLILHNGGGAAWYFWFLADFLILIGSLASAIIAFRHYRKMKEKKEKAEDDDDETATEDAAIPMPKFGFLPLLYTVWLFYALLLIAKIILLFKLEIAQNLDSNTTFGPQLLKIIIASSALVFLLLVETHNNAEPHSLHQAYIYYLITSTMFEIFDSVTFLGILFPNESKIVLTYHLENTILGLSCVNFVLPTIALYKLSMSEFGSRPRPLGIQILYKFLHLCLINIPYIVVRIYLWSSYDHDITLFLLKNILSVIMALRTSYSDATLWWQMIQENRRKNPIWPKLTKEPSAVYEITDDHMMEERQLNENGEKVPITTQL